MSDDADLVKTLVTTCPIGRSASQVANAAGVNRCALCSLQLSGPRPVDAHFGTFGSAGGHVLLAKVETALHTGVLPRCPPVDRPTSRLFARHERPRAVVIFGAHSGAQ